MFDTIRNHKKYLMGFLLILIIPSFVLFGVKGLSDSNQQRGATVASVDGQDISQQDWDQAHEAETQRLRESMPSLDPKLLQSEEARYSTLERLVRDRVLQAAAQKLHLLTTDQRLARNLQSNQAIASLRGADGKLDVDAYRQLLGRQGMTPESFEARVRADLSQVQVTKGIQTSGLTTPALAKVALDAFFQRREARIVRFNPQDFAARVQPSDAELEAFYSSNAQLFQAPEQVDLEYLVLDAAALESGVTLAEADLRAYYEQNASQLAGGEERRASHILLTVPPGASADDKEAVRKRAAQLLDQVRKAPETFAAVATANSQDPGSAANGGDLEFFGRGAMVKPFEEAVFALQKGSISDLVESDFGFHIIQLTDIKTPPVRSFESMRPEIEAALRKQQAKKLFAETAESFSNLVYEQGDSLKPAADQLKLKIQTATGVQRQPRPGAGVLSSPRLLETVFSPTSLESKRNTEAVETASSQLVSARVIRYSKAQTQPLSEVREVVRTRLIAQRSAELAREAGEKQLADWKSGADASKLPPAQTLARDDPQGLSGPVLNAVLSANAQQLPVWVGVSQGEQGYTVVRVDQVLARLPREPAIATKEQQQYSDWWASAESLAYYEQLKQRFKVQIKVKAPAVLAVGR
jgi:peptidyl-prolyl cis-trans isomerase D